MDVDSPNGINMGIVGRLTYPHIRNDGVLTVHVTMSTEHQQWRFPIGSSWGNTWISFIWTWLQICLWNRGTSIQHVRDLGGVPIWWSDEQEVAGSDKNLPISDHSDHYQQRKETILDLLTKTHGHINKKNTGTFNTVWSIRFNSR